MSKTKLGKYGDGGGFDRLVWIEWCQSGRIGLVLVTAEPFILDGKVK